MKSEDGHTITDNITKQLITGAGLTTLTVLIHAFGTTQWLRLCISNFGDDIGGIPVYIIPLLLAGTALYLFALHIGEALLWAVTYHWIVPEFVVQPFERAVYFSLVTFTSLGFGDVVLERRWRVLSGTQAVSGLIINGWTAAFMFTMVSDIWKAKLL